MDSSLHQSTDDIAVQSFIHLILVGQMHAKVQKRETTNQRLL